MDQSMKENLHIWQQRNFLLKTETKLSPHQIAEVHRNNIEHLKSSSYLNTLDDGSLDSALRNETRKYVAIVDETDTAKGLNNFAESSITMATGCKSDSEKWKSRIKMETIENLPCVRKLAEKTRDFELEKKVEKYGHLRLMKCKSEAVKKTDHHSVQRRMESNTTNTAHNYKFGSKSVELNNVSKKKKYEEDIMEIEPAKPKFAFRSAREQFDLNKVKKHDNNSPQQQGKRSLGSRPRNQCFAKFVPPTTSDQRDSNERNTEPTNNTELDPKLKGVDPQLVELIMSEIMDHGAPIQWDDIAGLHYAKETIKEIVIWPMLRPDIFTGLRGPPKGILLFGPPGTGKTLIGKCIANESCATFFSISASSLTSKWIGQGEKMVRALFAVANLHQPAVIFIDEIDSLLSQRSETEHESSRRIKTEFLVQLDGATTSSEDRILVVGATNRPHEIDEAARRRLVKRLYIPLPEAEAREQIINKLMQQQPCQLSQGETESIVGRTDGYSGADVTNLCKEAALGPIRSLQVMDISRISKEDVRPIQIQDFDKALTRVKASVSQKDLLLYSEWNKTFGCGTL